MASHTQRVMIAGAGPGGLLTAIALRQSGFEPRVFERVRTPDRGCAFTLWPNAMGALEGLGLGAAIRAVTRPFDGIAMLQQNGRPLFRIDGATMRARFGHSGLAIERQELMDILRQRLDESGLHFGIGVRDFTQDTQSVTVNLDDGSSVTAAALIAADGMHSVIRSRLHGDRALRFAGYRVWRGVSEFAMSDSTAFTLLGRGLQFGLFPMAAGRVYWFAAAGATRAERAAPAQSREDVSRKFADWPHTVRDVIDGTPPSRLVCNDIFDLDPLPSWSRGRVTLLGDAAHPSTPDLGQGLCQAVEDAVTLARAMREQPSVSTALESYEEARKPRTRWVTLQSRKVGQSGTWRNRLACYLRDRAIRSIPISMHLSQLQAMFHFGG